MQLFDMCSYDIDSFREFIQTSGFSEIYEIDSDELETLLKEEDELLQFAMRFLKQVLFGIMTIPMKADAQEKRMRRIRERLDVSQELPSS